LELRKWCAAAAESPTLFNDERDDEFIALFIVKTAVEGEQEKRCVTVDRHPHANDTYGLLSDGITSSLTQMGVAARGRLPVQGAHVFHLLCTDAFAFA
jgi:hypothetical protein